MSYTSIEWLSSLAAIQRLRKAGIVDPISTLTHLAEARQVRARASWGRFDGLDSDQEFPQEPKNDPKSGELLAPWPDIPADFWRWVNAGQRGSEVIAEAGVFAATVVYDPELGAASDKEHIKLFGVSFLKQDLEAFLQGGATRHDTPHLVKSPRSNAGRKPKSDGWAEFGAALAFVANADDPVVNSSQSALYAAAAGALKEKGWSPLDDRTVRNMVRHAHYWIEAGEVPQKVDEA
jgi:hypothetical protein